MDFLGFLEGKRNFLEFLSKRKLSLTDRPHGIPGSQLRPGFPVARGGAWLPTGQPQPIRRLPVRLAAVWPLCGLDPEWRAAFDPGDLSAATRACGLICARGLFPCSGDGGAAGSVKKDGGASGLVGGGGLGAWVAGAQGAPARASRAGVGKR
jgi:hypothetical protein